MDGDGEWALSHAGHKQPARAQSTSRDAANVNTHDLRVPDAYEGALWAKHARPTGPSCRRKVCVLARLGMGLGMESKEVSLHLLRLNSHHNTVR